MEQVCTIENVREAAEYIASQASGIKPEVALVLGSGLNGLAEVIEDAKVIDYADVPHMVKTTVSLHKGKFVVGTLNGKQIICMQGRLHAYEGWTADQIAFPIYVMKQLGAETLIVTNASGGINASFGVGDVMIIDDQVNMLGMDPCIGPEQPELRARFFDMTYAFDRDLRKLADEKAAELGITVQHGVYVAEPGPSFETPAEIRMYRTMGIDAVGMSTVLEVIAARSCDMRVLGISLISNPAAGVLDEPLSMDDVMKAAATAANRIEALVSKVVEALD